MIGKSTLIHVQLGVLLAALSCSSKSHQTPKKPETLILYITSELKGSMEPCGCTTDPLGDISRTAQLIEEDRANHPVVYIDGGSTLYTDDTIPNASKPQEQLKAKILADIVGKELQATAIGLGTYDLSLGVEGMHLPRLAANVKPAPGLDIKPWIIHEAAGQRIGVFGIASPNISSDAITVTDPLATTKQAVRELKAEKVDLIVGLFQVERDDALKIVRGVEGVDLAVAANGCPEDPTEVSRSALQVGNTWVVQPANRGQTVVRLELSLDGEGPLHDAIGKGAAAHRIAVINSQLDSLRDKLETWKKDPNADPAFLKTKQNELAELVAERKSLSETPLRAPVGKKWFAFEQIDIRKGLDCSAKIVAAKEAYDKAAGAANVAAAQKIPPIPVPEGQATYVGMEECSDCHQEAVDFWQQTKHAFAWQTLEKDHKQFDYECTGCHVTGWDKPGGSTMAKNIGLRNVQCEVCHGPGSKHIEDNETTSILLSPKESLCVGCHNKLHSDTFDFVPYLRDVTGPGHAPAFRKKLGDGKTGAELRAAGLAKAGLELGKNCKK